MYEKMLRAVCILTLGLLTSSVLVVMPPAEVAAEQADASPTATQGAANASATPTHTATAVPTEAVTATLPAPTAVTVTETPDPSPTGIPTQASTPTPVTPTAPPATGTATMSPTISPTASATPTLARTTAPPVTATIPSTDELGDDTGPENVGTDMTGARPAAVGAISSTILIANPVSTTASITLSVRDPLGTEVYGTNTALTGTGVLSFTLPASLGTEFQGSALVSANQPVQAFVLNSNAANTSRDIYDGAQAPSTALTFPIFRHLGNDAQKSIIAVQNLDPSGPAIVTLHYYKPDGSEAAGSPLAPVAVLPRASTYFDSFQLFGSSAVTYTARVESTKNIAGAEQILFKADTASLRGLRSADEGSQFYLDWVERKVLTSGAITNWSEIYVRNQGSTPTEVKVTYYLPSGLIRTSEKKIIPPNGLGLYSTQKNRAVGTGFAGYARVTQTGTQPLAVEWLEVNGGGSALYGFHGVVSTQTSTRWACSDARRFTVNPAQKTKFKIVNTSTTAAKLKVTLFNAANGKAAVSKNYTINPKVQLTVDLGGLAYQILGKAFQGWALFESPNGKQLTVAAFTSYGTLGYTGYTCAALPAASTNAYMPFVVRGWTHPVPSPALPPDPVIVAPPLDPSVATSVLDETAFLYTGSNPIQTGVAPGTIQLQRAAVLRGRVLTRDGQPLPAVTINVLGHPEFGETRTRADGKFDLAVNGGGVLTVQYAAQGLLTVQRQVEVPWQDYVILPDVVMIAVDSQVTAVDLTANTPIQVAQGSPVSDSDGSRQATVLVRQGTTATMSLPNGTTQPLSALHIRATEFTVGSNGPQTMPAELPPGSGYTYAVELTADEARAADATGIAFNQALPFYIQNFLGFPVGGIVPTGYYDRTAGKWIAAPNGRVIKVLSVTAGLADLDLDGSGVPANGAALAALGITDAERQQLAGLYQPGQSIWRVPIDHFSIWDHNWPYSPPEDATSSDQEDPFAEPVEDPCQSAASIISCETQTLGENVPVVGTRFSLHYESDRHPGRKDARSIDVPLSGPSIAGSLKRIELEIDVAGQIFRKQFTPGTNLDFTYVWDGNDAYGRPVQGERLATIRLIYVYPAVYREPAQFASSFGGLSGGSAISGVNRSALEIYSEQVWQGTLGNLDARPVGLGGWNLSVHQTYDPAGRTLYPGSGGKRSQAASAPSVVTIAGGGNPPNGLGDGGPANQARLYYATDVAVAPDGSYYILDTYHYRVRRVGTDGIITTAVGNGVQCDLATAACGDGGQATLARIGYAENIALGPDGSIYIVEGHLHRVRRVGPDGIITTFAGTGVACAGATLPCGDGGPPAQAQLYYPDGIVAGADGSVYISDGGDRRIRRVGPDGIITTAVGTGELCNPGTAACGDGGPAAAAKISQPRGLALGADGTLYIADTFTRRIRGVEADGVITTVAGSGIACANLAGACGDGGPALQAQFHTPRGLAVGRNGSLYITDAAENRVRRVDSDGSILGVAGSGIRCDAPFAPCGDLGPATAAGFNYLHHAAVGPDDTLYLADTSNSRVRQVKPFLQGFSAANSLIASEDGQEAYLFDHLARHVRTVNTFTGATLYEFTYDAAGRLATITDGDGNVTTVEHDTNGNPTGIVGPYGQRTALGVDSNGYLNSITNPASETVQLTSSTDGLLKTLTDARGGVHTFTYDALGRLTKDEDPAGGSKTLVRTDAVDGYSVEMVTSLGVTTTYQVQWLPTGGHRRLIVQPGGAQTEIVQGTNGQRVSILPDGTMFNLMQGPDPRFGMQSPLPLGVIISTPGGLTSTILMTRTVTLASSTPFSLTNQTDKVTVNGRLYTTVYDGAARRFTATSPASRAYTSTIDAQGRVVRYAAPAVAPFAFTYDNRGRLAAAGQEGDGESWTLGMTYNSSGYVQEVTDPLGRVTSYTYDAAGRPKQETLPGARSYVYGYDDNGNRTGVTPPDRPAHGFSYTPIDKLENYTPPDIGAAGGPTGYQYNVDRHLKKVTLPTGQTIELGYDTAGRFESLTIARGQTSYGYSAQTGNLSSISAPGGLGLTFGYDGSLHTSETWTGAVAGSLTRTFDKDFRITAVGVNGTSVAAQYDADSLLVQIGNLTLTRDAVSGLITGTGLGTVTDSRSYNTFGETKDYTAQAGSTPVYSVNYTRDGLGRITRKVETIGGQTTTYDYDYYPTGRLKEVKKSGVTTASYVYDTNGNRLNAIGAGGTVTGTYDLQDRLLEYDTATYTYTKDGRLQSKVKGSETTSYQYDELGNLTAVTLPSGKQIDYLVDGLSRRIGRKENGILVQGLLYDGLLRPIAELDGAGNVVSRFVYATGVNVPDYMVKGGVNYRIVADQLGSPRLVVNATTGAIAQRMDYDAFGNVVNDTAPGFQPFGFAGGLYDRDTGLVRFSARDYDPETGRWTTKDPLGFKDGHTNVYLYARADPVNLTDPSGLECPSFWDKVLTFFGIASDVAVAPFDQTPPVVAELKPLLSEDGAKAQRGGIDMLQQRKALQVLRDTGNTDEYSRIMNMPLGDFLAEFAQGWNGQSSEGSSEEASEESSEEP